MNTFYNMTWESVRLFDMLVNRVNFERTVDGTLRGRVYIEENGIDVEKRSLTELKNKCLLRLTFEEDERNGKPCAWVTLLRKGEKMATELGII